MTLARILEDWIARSDGAWRSGDEVALWSRLFGSDVERAYAECPRGDWLVAIAGACGASPHEISAVAIEIAEEALPLVVRGRATLAKTVAAARHGSRGEIEACLRRSYALLDRIDAATDEAHEALAEAMARAGQALMSRGGAWAELDSSARRERALRLGPARSLAALWRRRAVLGACRAAVSAAISGGAAALALRGHSLAPGARPTSPGDAAQSPAEASVFAASALALSDAALAARELAMADAEGLAVLVDALAAAASSRELAPAASRALGVASAAAERAERQRAHEIAQRVRARVGFSSLQVPMDRRERIEQMRGDPRRAFRRLFDESADAMRALGEPPIDTALDALDAMLRASGPFDTPRYLRSIATLFESFAASLERDAAQRQGLARATTLERAAEARRMAREMAEMGCERGRATN